MGEACQMTNTHLLLPSCEYLEPASLGDALWLLEEQGNGARVLASGTYLLVQMKQERQAPDCLISLRRVPGLVGGSWVNGALQIGSRTTIRQVHDLAEVRASYAALAEACAAFGSMQIQMMGTIGGNVCNGSPASDAVPALVAFDGQLALVGPEGKRTLPVSEFLLAPGQTAIRPGEILISILLPSWPSGTGSAFAKVSRVEADLAKVSAAAVLVREGDRIADCRLAFGSVAPTVVRAQEAEAMLIGRRLDAVLALHAGEVASQEVSPIDDVRSSAWYRRQIVKAVTHDVLLKAWDRAGDGRAVEFAGAAGAQAAGSGERVGETLRVGPEERHRIDLTVNGERRQLWVAPNELLLNLLRERLEITGPKYGCGIGECGACTVLLDGSPVLACLTLALSADGSQVLTVEGLQRPDGQLHPLQEAFVEHQGFQCGYCTPGMLMMSKTLLEQIPSATEDDVRSYLRGNRCRCTGYASIVRSVLSCVEPAGTSGTPK